MNPAVDRKRQIEEELFHLGMNKKKKKKVKPTDSDDETSSDDESTSDDDVNKDDDDDDTSTSDEEFDFVDFEGCVVESHKPKPKKLELPGGEANAIPLGNSCAGSGIGEVPKEVTRYIRDYLDMVFGAVMLGAERVTSMNQRSSVHVIPEVVDAMLIYNNREFDVMTCDFESRVDLVEPIWYTMDVANSRLNLFIDQMKYDDFCLKHSDLSVLFPGGTIPIDIFDPCKDNPNFGPIELAMIKCVIACDHVVTHILSDMMDESKLPCSDYHKDYANYGTTLHTMFQLDLVCSPVSRCQFESKLIPFPLLPNTFASGLLSSDVKDDYTRDRLNIPRANDDPFLDSSRKGSFTFQYP